ncbi:MAG: MBL fold metallo-hydrolase [Candidatus Staskawiczbacteria bacterium]|nr:MBL fold metallo-hydrolase [Candidatus Staskawiczbacteria bacterium]
MKITWAGQSCFQISASSNKEVLANIVIDPFSDIGLKMPNFDADILLSTHGHEDHNNFKAVKGNPFLIEGSGEYEVKGVFIKGIDSFHDDNEGKERGKNTIYTIEVEDMKVCHLGDIGQKQLTDDQLEKIGHVDILMIPVGGVYTIDSSEAQKIIGQIEPKVVIPMHYEVSGLKIKLDNVSKFLKASGRNSIEPIDKFTVKASTLPKERDMDIVLLKP